MTYEVQFQVGTAEYTVRGPDIDGVLRLIQGVQGAEDKSDYERCQEAAVTTLRDMGYEWRGGEQWAPPVGPKQPDWIEWSGGACPVSPDARLEVVLRNGVVSSMSACYVDWAHHGCPSDVVRYRVCA